MPQVCREDSTPLRAFTPPPPPRASRLGPLTALNGRTLETLSRDATRPMPRTLS